MSYDRSGFTKEQKFTAVHDRETALLDWLYRTHMPRSPWSSSTYEITEQAKNTNGESIYDSQTNIARVVRRFIEIDKIMTRSLPTPGVKGAVYELLLERAHAERIVAERHARELEDFRAGRMTSHDDLPITGRRKRRKTNGVEAAPMTNGTSQPEVVVTTAPEEEVKAIAGVPEPATIKVPGWKMGDAEALIEAAHQYQNRKSAINAKVEELVEIAKEYGVSFDREALEASMSFEVDERLETVGLLIPHITMLENKLRILGERIEEQKGATRALATAKQEIDRLKEQNERILTEWRRATKSMASTTSAYSSPR